MKVAITGGTGFVGRHLARALADAGHEVILMARGSDRRDEKIRELSRAYFFPGDISDKDRLIEAFAGCEGVAHCAGINREIREQTYQKVHIEGTRNVISAARTAGVRKIVLISFLRARPNCGSAYHESKWDAEELIRSSGLDYTVIKAGLIYGKGDHLLDHLTHALHTVPVFALVGMNAKTVRPVAVEDVVRIHQSALLEDRLSRKTVAVVGPEELTFRELVSRVARVVGKRPFVFSMPVVFHYLLAWWWERVMTVPLISIAQVRMLAEGIVEPLPPCDELPNDLRPETSFTDGQIRCGLPERKSFGLKDFRWGPY